LEISNATIFKRKFYRCTSLLISRNIKNAAFGRAMQKSHPTAKIVTATSQFSGWSG